LSNKLVVDIANYTAGVDPIPLHQASVQMAILKVDELFARNARIFHNSGMPVAAYHWIDPTKDPVQQVSLSLSIMLGSNVPILAVFADFEQYWAKWDEWYRALRKQLDWRMVGRLPGDKLSIHARQVFELFKDSEFKTFGYTSASFISKYAPQAAEWMPQYRWWLAHHVRFGNHVITWEELKTRVLPSINFPPALPPGMTQDKVVGHQFSSEEFSLPGLYADIQRTKYSPADVNLFDDQFLREIGAIPNPKPMAEPQYEVVVTALPNLNIRSGPGPSFEKLYSVNNGQALQITEIRDGWAKLRSYGEEWCSEQYIKIIITVHPDPDDDIPPVDNTPPFEVNYPGVIYQKVRRFNSDCHILRIDPKGKRFHVTPYTSLKTVSRAARETRAQIVINGDGWGIGGRFPNSIAASDGRIYQNRQMDYRPWVNILRDNQVVFAWRNPANLYNTISGDRYLILNGRYNAAISNVTPDPRTVFGVTREGKILLIVADGRTPENRGLTFFEISSLMLEFGVVTAINLDGGGSSAMWIKDRIVNIPINENIPGREREVANHLCVFIN
jgi:hypothetical protein